MKQWKVLLIDDEDEFVTTLAERLELRGIHALTETDGQEALARIKTDKPQVVVLDIMMPGVNGLDVLRHIKRSHPGIPVILLTGRGTTSEGVEGMRMGAFDFMMKPVKIEDLISKLSDALEIPKNQKK